MDQSSDRMDPILRPYTAERRLGSKIKTKFRSYWLPVNLEEVLVKFLRQFYELLTI